MFNCHVCHSEESHSEYVKEIFEINSQFYLVENIPTTVCSRCGEEIFSSETTEAIRAMLHNKQKPLRAITVDVFAYPI
jgi:hypothetical protein